VVQSLGARQLAEDGIGERDDWVLRPAMTTGTAFGNLAPGFNMLDPIKATVITPGLDVKGQFAETGIPASIVTRYLVEHGVIVEKTGLYSFFIMFTIGITKGRWNTLLSALQQFKDDYDKNHPMWKILPEFCATVPAVWALDCVIYANRSTTCTSKNDVARVTTEMYLSPMQPAMKPSDALCNDGSSRD
jgi:arginine decarboxylase